jgi:hypothetical protein
MALTARPTLAISSSPPMTARALSSPSLMRSAV